MQNIFNFRVHRLALLSAIIFVYGCDDSTNSDGVVLKVPEDYTSIQEAIDNSTFGSEIEISCGIYKENIYWENKKIIISGSSDCRTIVDGGGRTVFNIIDSNGTKLKNLYIFNGDDGISTNSVVVLENNIFSRNIDGVDYEGGGGELIDNVFLYNKDDAIDLDYDVSVNIQSNRIFGSGDDGVEIRLHESNEPIIDITIRNNEIFSNQADGIQIIDYEGDPNRRINIYNNVFDNNMAAISYNDDKVTVPSYTPGLYDGKVIIESNVFSNNEIIIRLNGDGTTIKNNVIDNTTRIQEAISDIKIGEVILE